MQHIILREGEVVTGVICVEREISSCIILLFDPNELNQLFTIAKAQKVDGVKVIVPTDLVDDLKSRDWTLLENLRIMERKK